MSLSSLLDSEIPKYHEIVFNNIKEPKINKKVKLSKTSRHQLIQVIQNELALLRKKRKDIKTIKLLYKLSLQQIGAIEKNFGHKIQRFDEKSGFDDATRNSQNVSNNLIKLERLKTTIELIEPKNILVFVETLQKHFSIGKKIADIFENLFLILQTIDCLLGNQSKKAPIKSLCPINQTEFINPNLMLLCYQEPGTRNIRLKTHLQNPKHSIYFNELIVKLISCAKKLEESQDDLMNLLKTHLHKNDKAIKRLSRDIRAFKTMKPRKMGHSKVRTQNTLRILLLTHEFLEGGGVSTVTKNMQQNLSLRGNVTVDVIEHKTPKTATNEPYLFYYNGGEPIIFESLAELLLILKKFHYHLIHIHSLSFSSVFAGGLDQILETCPNAKLIYTCHSVVAHERRVQKKHKPWGSVDIDAQNDIMQKADKITHLTEFGTIIAHGHWKEYLAIGQPKRNSPYPHFRDKACIIPNGINLTFDFFSSQKNRLTEKNDDIITLGYIGRLAEEKGVITLSKAFSKHNNTNIQLKVIGKESVGSGIKNVMKNHLIPVAGRYQFLGFLKGNALDNAINELDIVIIPSYNESFSIVTLDALSKNIPVIISNVDGPRELFIQANTEDRWKHKYALGIDPHDETTISSALSFCLDNPQQVVHMVQLGREKIKDTFHWDYVVSQYEELYACTINQKKFAGDWQPQTENVPSLPKHTNGYTIGLIYDMDSWSSYIHYLEDEGFQVNTWGSGYHHEKLEAFIPKCDLILICWSWAEKWWPYLIKTCRQFGKPTLMKYENGFGLEQDNIREPNTREALREATYLIPTDMLSSWVLKKIGVPIEKQIIIPNGLDFLKINEKHYLNQTLIQNKQMLNIPEHNIVGGFFGNLDKPSNVKYLLEAFRALCQTEGATNRTLLLYGPVPESDIQAFCEEMINEYGGKIFQDGSEELSIKGPLGAYNLILNHIDSYTWQNVELRLNYMSACDFVMIPNGWGIGNSMIAAEAMALGKPVALLDAISHPFAYGDAGIYFPTDQKTLYDDHTLYHPSLKQLTQQLSTLFSDNQLRQLKEAQSLDYAENYLDLEQHFKTKLFPIINQILGRDHSITPKDIVSRYQQDSKMMIKTGKSVDASYATLR
jgi:glycosyltransferase involved in cell wall biosynthesis